MRSDGQKRKVRREKLTQALKARAEWVEFSLLSDADLYKWCGRRVSPRAIEPDAVEQLAKSVTTQCACAAAAEGLEQDVNGKRSGKSAASFVG